MKNTWPTGAKSLALLALAAVMAGCAVVQTEPPLRIGLLAPFEGRYREIGYNALYAARLALDDAGYPNVELLAVDGGGTVESAADRARALADDPLVMVVVAVGYDAAQVAYGDLAVIVAGNWSATPQTETMFVLSSADLPGLLSSATRLDVTHAAEVEAPFTGGEVFALESFRRLRSDFDGITVITSGGIPGDEFRRRYLESDQFAPEPGLLATMTYDTVRLAVEAINSSDSTRASIVQQISTIHYDGTSGVIRFEGGYWANAPINVYTYTLDGQLRPAGDCVIE
jgi:ABC-type branched-subunit amino acid transport system substrate-binding protein